LTEDFEAMMAEGEVTCEAVSDVMMQSTVSASNPF
jgi:hypothetical protein